MTHTLSRTRLLHAMAERVMTCIDNNSRTVTAVYYEDGAFTTLAKGTHYYERFSRYHDNLVGVYRPGCDYRCLLEDMTVFFDDQTVVQ